MQADLVEADPHDLAHQSDAEAAAAVARIDQHAPDHPQSMVGLDGQHRVPVDPAQR